jgi:ABC-type Na+ efflux pump permease subunit
MKILDIAFKDIQRAFRSAFGVAMMFIVPIMVPAIIYAAFGGALSGNADSGGFNIAVTRVVVVNLDQAADQSAGAILAGVLQSQELRTLLETTTASDEAAARDRVNTKQADVAVIIPADFTQAAFMGSGESNIVLYHDPTLTIGPLIVKQLLAQFADGFSGARIALDVAQQQTGTLDPAVMQTIA